MSIILQKNVFQKYVFCAIIYKDYARLICSKYIIIYEKCEITYQTGRESVN